jgi:hypothetical protein
MPFAWSVNFKDFSQRRAVRVPRPPGGARDSAPGGYYLLNLRAHVADNNQGYTVKSKRYRIYRRLLVPTQ